MNAESLETLLEEKFKGFNSLLEEKFKNSDACHERVEKQVAYTNGRVRRLEKISYTLGGAILVLGWQLANMSKIKEVLISLVK